MRAALLYYQCFCSDILSIGFKINPYDPCVANKIVEGNQLTLVWHVDDIKVSHVKPSIVTHMVEWLHETYERVFDDGSGLMKVSRGKLHEYLGMTLDFETKGKVTITMIPYVKEIVDQFGKYDPTAKTASSPAAAHLFNVNEQPTLLSKDQAEVFHHFVAKSLFLTKCACPDIAIAVSFLTTCVKSPDEDD